MVMAKLKSRSISASLLPAWSVAKLSSASCQYSCQCGRNCAPSYKLRLEGSKRTSPSLLFRRGSSRRRCDNDEGRARHKHESLRRGQDARQVTDGKTRMLSHQALCASAIMPFDCVDDAMMLVLRDDEISLCVRNFRLG